MSLAIWLGVGIGAALGAPLRFAVDRFFVARVGTNLPWGTFTVNLLGSLILGLLTGITFALSRDPHGVPTFVNALVGTGFCGALTTFSGFSSQVLELTRDPLQWRGPAYALISVTLGFALAATGYAIGAA